MSRRLSSCGAEDRSSRRILPTVLPCSASRRRCRTYAGLEIRLPTVDSGPRLRTPEVGSPESVVRSPKSTVSFPNASPVHDRRRRRVPDRRSQHLGTAVARLGAAGLRQPVARRPDEARDAPVDRRSRHDDLRGRPPAAARDAADADRAVRRGRPRRPGGRGRRHASVLDVDRSGDLAGRTLPAHRRGTAAAGAVAAHLRPARPRRDARPRVDDRHHERGAVLPAAPAGAVDQLAVLDGPRHRAEVVSHDDLPPLPAHGRPRSLRLVERVRELSEPAHRSALHRRRQEDLVGHPAASDVRHAGVPRLRRADARRGHDCASPRSRRPSS